MTKHRLFFSNITKEEAWINRMIRQGFRLKKVSWGRYEFEPLHLPDSLETTQSREKDFLPLVRIDFRTFSKKSDFADYLALFEDYGWNHIAGNKSNGIQYFEKMRPDCQEEIFSDSLSKAGRYWRISCLWLGLLALYLPLLVIYSGSLLHFPSLSNWKELYYTPGLWDMEGPRFWAAFLFETPFAAGRALGGFFPLFLLVMSICYGFFALKALYWYWKEKEK